MYMRNSSKKRKYLIVKLFGTRSCDGSLYVCSCRYNGCINRRDVHIKAVVMLPSLQGAEGARERTPDQGGRREEKGKEKKEKEKDREKGEGEGRRKRKGGGKSRGVGG